MKLAASIRKESLLLVRDLSGLAIIFIMPMFMVLVMALIQDVTFKRLDQSGIKVLLLDQDRDALGKDITEGLEASGFFKVSTVLSGDSLSPSSLEKAISRGDFQIGILIHGGATETIRESGKRTVRSSLFGIAAPADSLAPAKITLYFDPVIKTAEKQSILSALQNFTAQVEAGLVFESVSKEISRFMPLRPGPVFDLSGTVFIEEIYATGEHNEILPNATQHNVPAWTMFAMFFIIIPLTGNLIKERESGTALRIRMMPGRYSTILLSKIAVYVAVCFIQFILMLLVGMYILPLFGLPALILGPHPGALAVIAISAALAATGYGVMVGTLSTTHDQAAVFGTVSVIILAAIGGTWVPVFMMPGIMQQMSQFSPLNWGLEGFQEIFLRGGGLLQVIKHTGLLLGFFIVTLSVALFFEKKRRP